MIPAIILFVGVLGASPAVGHVVPAFQTQSSNQQSVQPAEHSPGTSTKNSGGATEKVQSAKQSSSSSSEAQAAKRTGKNQKKSSVNCDSAAGGNSSPKSAKSAPSNTGKTPATGFPCPPKKVIVRQGSTSEPSIEVVGGAGGRQASDERNTAIQMWETTEVNLKKIEGMQLNSNQQDMVKQVREFMDQSKAATSAGDLDQARTLAWKAQMLSEDLLKTQK
jgi:hypothetical protein